jgi:hypothetical protein
MAPKKLAPEKPGSTNFDAKLLVNYSKRRPTGDPEHTGLVKEAGCDERAGSRFRRVASLLLAQAGRRESCALIRLVASEQSAWR